MFGNNNNQGGGILGFNMNPRTARGLQAAGLAMSQLAAGRPANLAPLHKQMLDEQRQAQMQQAIGPALEKMPPQMRAVLASMPPELAQKYIMDYMMAKPAASPIAGLEARAAAAGLQPGTPEYQQFMLTGGKAVAGDGDKYGLTPQIVSDADGNLRLVQLSDKGGFKVIELPEGFKLEKGLDKVDMGTHFQMFDIAGEPVGPPIPKNVAEAAGEAAAGQQAIDLSGEAFKSYGNITKANSTISEAISALDAGARSGAIDKYLPNVTEASARLETAMNEMGLDVIAAVTFGALSEKELRLAMETAVPRNLDEPALRAWLIRKREANEKSAAMILDAAIFLSEPGNTLNDWVKRNKQNADATTTSNAGGNDPLELFE